MEKDNWMAVQLDDLNDFDSFNNRTKQQISDHIIL